MTFTFKERLQADNTKWIHFIFTDGVNEIHKHRRRLKTDDATIVGNSLIPNVENEIKDREKYAVLQDILNGKDSLTAVQGVKYATQKDTAYTILKYVMAQEDMAVFLKLQSLITYLTTNYTGAELAKWLGVDIATLAKINNRYQNALSVQTAITTNESLITDI